MASLPFRIRRSWATNTAVRFRWARLCHSVRWTTIQCPIAWTLAADSVWWFRRDSISRFGNIDRWHQPSAFAWIAVDSVRVNRIVRFSVLAQRTLGRPAIEKLISFSYFIRDQWFVYPWRASKQGWCFHFNESGLIDQIFTHFHQHIGSSAQIVLHIGET